MSKMPTLLLSIAAGALAFAPVASHAYHGGHNHTDWTVPMKNGAAKNSAVNSADAAARGVMHNTSRYAEYHDAAPDGHPHKHHNRKHGKMCRDGRPDNPYHGSN